MMKRKTSAESCGTDHGHEGHEQRQQPRHDCRKTKWVKADTQISRPTAPWKTALSSDYFSSQRDLFSTSIPRCQNLKSNLLKKDLVLVILHYQRMLKGKLLRIDQGGKERPAPLLGEPGKAPPTYGCHLTPRASLTLKRRFNPVIVFSRTPRRCGCCLS
jgi:hypothetical protein